MTATAHRAKYWLCAKKALLAFCSCASVIWAQDHNPGCKQFAGPILWKFNDSKCGRLTFFTWCFFVHSLSLHTGLLQSKQYRLAAKQAAQVCCKASSTGLLQSNYWVCCKAIKQFPAEKAKVCCWKLASLSEAVCEEWSALCELLRGTSLVNWLCHFLDQVFRALSLTLWEHTLMEFVNLTLGV